MFLRARDSLLFSERRPWIRFPSVVLYLGLYLSFLSGHVVRAFASVSSLKRIDREGLEEGRAVTTGLGNVALNMLNCYVVVEKSLSHKVPFVNIVLIVDHT